MTNMLSYRHTLGQLLSRHLMPGLMPTGSGTLRTPKTPAQLSPDAVARLLQQANKHNAHGGRQHGQPLTTFNAPQPAAHLSATSLFPGRLSRAEVERLPQAGGVYIFRGSNDLPLYVGRSVNLRSRVLAHLHDADDQLLARQAQRIEYRRCAGELGAALMETSLRRQLQPAHNKKEGHKRCLHTLRLEQDGRVAVAKVAEREFSRAGNLFGIFASQRAALEALHKLVEQHHLCSITCGLEQAAGPGMACFGRQIRRCRGACTGEESQADHQARLLRALEDLRIVPWPYQGPMGIVERAEDGWTQIHVIDHWRYLGSLDREHPQLPQLSPGALMPTPARGTFDLASYKIVIQPYLLGQLELRALPGLQG